MRRLFITILILSATFPLFLKSQSRTINVIDFKVQDNCLYLEYKLNSNKPEDVLFILWDDDFNPSIPKSVEGSTGNAVKPDGVKLVKWNLYNDNDMLYSKLRPDLIALNDYEGKNGSQSAFYSMLVPGLGDYFVTDVRSMRFKPYLRTLSALGAISLGLIASNKIERPAVYTHYVNPWTNTVEERFSGYGNKQYWLFKHDNAFFLTIGLGIWVYDIIWVATKGGKNDKINKLLSNIELTQSPNGSFALGLNFPLK